MPHRYTILGKLLVVDTFRRIHPQYVNTIQHPAKGFPCSHLSEMVDNVFQNNFQLFRSKRQPSYFHPRVSITELFTCSVVRQWPKRCSFTAYAANSCIRSGDRPSASTPPSGDSPSVKDCSISSASRLRSSRFQFLISFQYGTTILVVFASVTYIPYVYNASLSMFISVAKLRTFLHTAKLSGGISLIRFQLSSLFLESLRKLRLRHLDHPGRYLVARQLVGTASACDEASPL